LNIQNTYLSLAKYSRKPPKSKISVPLLDSNQARDIVEEFFPNMWFYNEACLAAIGVQRIEDVVNPSSIIITGPPSSMKTTILDFSKDHPWTYHTDKFTPKAFVSQASNRKEEQLKKIDLLPRIKDKILIVPELAPLFTSRTEELQESMGVLTRIFDGQGYTLDAGSNGRRGYSGSHMFTLLAATTPLDNKVWRTMGKLGNRLNFLDMPPEVNDIDSSFLTDDISYKKKLELVQKENLKLLDALYNLPMQKWNRSSDPKLVIHTIFDCAVFGGLLRGVINSVGLRTGRYDRGSVSVEQPYRYSTQLYNLARGRALINGRTQIDASDLGLVREIVLSGTFELRSRVIRYLLSQKGTALQKSVVQCMGCSSSVAYEVIGDLVYLGAVEQVGSSGQASIKIPDRYYHCLIIP
jgi:hypothetical protein